MELNQALKNIENMNDKFAMEEIICIRENKEEAIPVLLKNLQNLIENFDEIPEDFDFFEDHTYAMFLLAEFGVHEAFEVYIKMIELEHEKCEWLLADMLSEDMPRLIASVAKTSDIERIKTVIENREIDEFQRDAALSSLVVMYVQDKYERAELFAYLGYLLEKFADDEMILTHIVDNCYQVHAYEFNERIFKLFDEDLIDRAYIRKNDFNDKDSNKTPDTTLLELKNTNHYKLITDIVECMDWWHCFNEEPEPKLKPLVEKTEKIGRNEPCPCGSGKKYKKCCLNN